MLLEIILVLAVVGLDRITKLWAVGSLMKMPGSRMSVIPGVVEFKYVENTGASFSMLSDHTWLLTLVSFAMVLLISFCIIKYHGQLSILERIGLASVLGGALGNLIDRALYGYVVDFINPLFINFAVFNIADIFITCGAILLVFLFLLGDKLKKNEG